MGAVSQKSCGVFATPGQTLSSNSKIYIITLFSECPISFNMVGKDLLPLVWIRQLCALRGENIDFGRKDDLRPVSKVLDKISILVGSNQCVNLTGIYHLEFEESKTFK